MNIKETLIRLEDVRDHLPSGRAGKRLGKAVCFRWASKGVRGVVLETVKIGGARFTSLEAIQRFVDEQNEQPVPRQPPAPPAVTRPRLPARLDARDRASATVELSKLGI